MNMEKTEYYFCKLMEEGLGLNLSDPNLIDTPARVAKMYCNEFFSCVGKEFDNFKSFPNTRGIKDIILLDKIHFVSMCAHHFLPFDGEAWILYIPSDKLVGASKMARVVNHYAKRPQLQEELSHEVIERFDAEVHPEGAMLFMRAVHGCMKCRGVNQYAGAGMITSAACGVFLSDPVLEQKGLEMIKISLMGGRIG